MAVAGVSVAGAAQFFRYAKKTLDMGFGHSTKYGCITAYVYCTYFICSYIYYVTYMLVLDGIGYNLVMLNIDP